MWCGWTESVNNLLLCGTDLFISVRISGQVFAQCLKHCSLTVKRPSVPLWTKSSVTVKFHVSAISHATCDPAGDKLKGINNMGCKGSVDFQKVSTKGKIYGILEYFANKLLPCGFICI